MINNKLIGQTIRELRQSFGLTQNELAIKLNVTYQAVSGWERGTYQLSLDNAYLLSKFFSVTIDYILNQENETNNLYLSVDGGGTKTEFVVFDKDGKIYKRFVLGSSNPNDIGLKQSIELLEKGISECLTECKGISFAFLGIAGALSANNSAEMNRLISKAFPFIKIEVGSDLENIMNCSTNADTTIIVGTGISCLTIDSNNKRHRLGGFGYLFDGAGSGYDIGHDVLQIALHDFEENKQSLVTKLLLKDYPDLTIDRIIKDAYSLGKPYIANFAYIMFDAYRKNDEIAIKNLDKQAYHIASLILNAKKLYGTGNKVFFAGGIIKNYKEILLPLIQKYADFEYEIESKPIIFGACKKCLLNANKYNASFDRKFMKSYKEIV